jgi:hypothetical protein
MAISVLSHLRPHTNRTQQPDVFSRLTDRLVADQGIEHAGGLFRDNVATYLFHLLRPSQAEALLHRREPVNGQDVIDHSQRLASVRWRQKLQRELASPYEDYEVFDRLDALDAQLQSGVNEVDGMAQGAPYSLFINGSLCKLRMGKNSDLDVTVDTPSSGFHDRLMDFFLHAPRDYMTFYPLSEGGEGRVEERLSGPRLYLGQAQDVHARPHLVSQFYEQMLTSRGYRIERHESGPLTLQRPPQLERKREANIVVEKFFDLTRADGHHNRLWRTLKNGIWNTVGAGLGTPLLAAPLGRMLGHLIPGSTYQSE